MEMVWFWGARLFWKWVFPRDVSHEAGRVVILLLLEEGFPKSRCIRWQGQG